MSSPSTTTSPGQGAPRPGSPVDDDPFKFLVEQAEQPDLGPSAHAEQAARGAQGEGPSEESAAEDTAQHQLAASAENVTELGVAPSTPKREASTGLGERRAAVGSPSNGNDTPVSVGSASRHPTTPQRSPSAQRPSVSPSQRPAAASPSQRSSASPVQRARQSATPNTQASTSASRPPRASPSPSSAEKAACSNRLRELHEEAERRNEKLRQLEVQLPPEYTFSPVINKVRGKEETSPGKRAEKLYEEARIREEKRRQAIEEAKKKIDPEATFKPTISTLAAKKATPGGLGARVEKLYADATSIQQKREALRLEAENRAKAEHTFKPTIQPLKIKLNEPRPPSPQRRAPSPSQPHAVPAVVSRLLSSDQKRRENLDRLKAELEAKEKEQFTFAPQVRPNSPRSAGGSQSGMKGEDKWARLSRSGTKDYVALEAERDRLATRDCTFKPVIHSTPSTSALVITSDKTDVHTRLYSQSKARTPATTPQQPRAGISPQVGRPIFSGRGTTISPKTAGSGIAHPTPSKRGISPVPLTSNAPSAVSRPQPAFGTTSKSRIPDAKQSEVVVPMNARDSSVVAPLDPRDSEVVIPESPVKTTKHAIGNNLSTNSSPERSSLAADSPSASRRPLSPVVNARPASPLSSRASPGRSGPSLTAKSIGNLADGPSSTGSAFRRSNASSTVAFGRSSSPKPSSQQRAVSPKLGTPPPPPPSKYTEIASSPRVAAPSESSPAHASPSSSAQISNPVE